MKIGKILFIFLLSVVTSFMTIVSTEENSYSEFRCTECHSKRAGAKDMHEALTGEDCFGCHVRGEKLRQKGGIPEERHQAFLEQRFKDARCTVCHASEKDIDSEVKTEDKPKKAKMLTGTTFCPKCQITGGSDWKMCPKCGENLINMDKLMFESALNPHQELCRKCHFMEDSLEKKHTENIGAEFSRKSDCLECHQGHSECSGCHQ